MGNICSVSVPSDAAVNRCWDCVEGQAKFVCKLEENVEALKVSVVELRDLRSDVVREVQNVEAQPHMKRLDQVQGWLSRAETLINEADMLIVQSPREINKLCLGGYCSLSPKSNLKFGKQIARKLGDVVDHKSKGVFDKVAEEVPAPLVTERPTEHTVDLESTFDRAWSILEAEHVGILGLYGMGGVGKTTLLEQINNKFCRILNKFDAVIWIVVSKGFYIGKIQDDIAEKILIMDGTWQNKTSEKKAEAIFMVLKKMKFVLLLDDIWERVDLSKVGIPLPTKENGSKLVFTTRSIKVCGQMEAHEKIELRCLSEESAWELFREKVGKETLGNNRRIHMLAHEVAKECGGLPLALVTIARAMAFKKTVEEWEYAIEVLRRSSKSVLPEMCEEVYPLLKFSYDFLPNDMIRTCLLYCSLLPEDYVIDKDSLIDLWIGEGFLDGHGNPSLARNQGHDFIGSLVRACLLEAVEEFGIKMHDVIRDMCLWIACKVEEEKYEFFVEAGFQLTKLPKVGNWGSIKKMSLMRNRIENLVETPNCPCLQTLLLSHNWLGVINNDFFQFMCSLNVLDLSYNWKIKQLPVGISKLVSLGCLDVSGTTITWLPIEFKALEQLKCLKLENIGRGDPLRIPRKLISSLLKLQVLRMKGSSYCFWEKVEDESEWMVEELEFLEHLNVWSFDISSSLALDRVLSNERLCNSAVDISFKSFKKAKRLNILPIGNMNCLNSLQFWYCTSLEEVEMELEVKIASQDCFRSLQNVEVVRCDELMDLTWLILAPTLRKLHVSTCFKMEEIISEKKLRGQVGEQVEALGMFAKLESLKLESLPKLKSIYWGALPLSCLKESLVCYCRKLKRLPLNSNTSAKEEKIKIQCEKDWWKELQWDDESTRNRFLPSFKLCDWNKVNS